MGEGMDESHRKMEKLRCRGADVVASFVLVVYSITSDMSDEPFKSRVMHTIPLEKSTHYR